jgi:uncharacterized membrane-anchored protein
MTKLPTGTLSKVPEVTLGFWVVKVLATTLGETGGDAVTMSMNLGYAIGSFIFIGIFAAAVVAQISAKAFHPFLYWVTIVATTTLGTTMADFADRSLGIGYFPRRGPSNAYRCRARGLAVDAFRLPNLCAAAGAMKANERGHRRLE